jgi:hypothetical protein
MCATQHEWPRSDHSAQHRPEPCGLRVAAVRQWTYPRKSAEVLHISSMR